jgi:hypothetical protein
MRYAKSQRSNLKITLNSTLVLSWNVGFQNNFSQDEFKNSRYDFALKRSTSMIWLSYDLLAVSSRSLNSLSLLSFVVYNLQSLSCWKKPGHFLPSSHFIVVLANPLLHSFWWRVSSCRIFCLSLSSSYCKSWFISAGNLIFLRIYVPQISHIKVKEQVTELVRFRISIIRPIRCEWSDEPTLVYQSLA